MEFLNSPLMKLFFENHIEPTDCFEISESRDYFASQFQIGRKVFLYRCAKVTPTKTGLFVTLWKRDTIGATVPFEDSDDVKGVVIFAQEEERMGAFVFSAEVHLQNNIIAKSNKGGKRGFRVYPP